MTNQSADRADPRHCCLSMAVDHRAVIDPNQTANPRLTRFNTTAHTAINNEAASRAADTVGGDQATHQATDDKPPSHIHRVHIQVAHFAEHRTE